MAKTKATVYLPKHFLEKFDSIDFTKSERNHALRFIDILMYRSYKSSGFTDSYVHISSKYFRKVFNSKYLSWLNKLVKNNILDKNSSYYINNYSISYSLNLIPNTHYPLPFLLPLFNKTDYKSVSYEFKKEPKTKEQEKIKSMVIEDFKKLKVDWNTLKDLATKMIDSVDIKLYRKNEEIKRNSVNVITFDSKGKDKKPFWMSRDSAISLAKSRNELLIEDEGRYYICDSFFFTLRKKMSMYVAYKSAIEKMERGIYYAKRNDRNFRLDSNITNMSSVFTNLICESNDLIQLDLCNAQFAILSHYFEDKLSSEDFEAFKKHSYDGTLYAHIQKELSLGSEKEAKVMMFELMFSKENLNSYYKTKLKELFPSVVNEVDAFKKEFGYNEFSVMLQKKESEMFIDGLWMTIKKNNKFCMTKHDSLIIKRKDVKFVKNIINNYFNIIKFNGTIK